MAASESSYMDIIITISILTIVLLFLLKPILPRWCSNFLDNCQNIFYLCSRLVVEIWRLSSLIIYYLGMFSTLFLCFIGIILVYGGFAMEMNYPIGFISVIYNTAVGVSKNHAAWAGATLIVATTVAIGHMRKQDLGSK